MSAIGDRAYALRRAVALLGEHPGRFLMGLLLATVALALPLLILAMAYTAAPWVAHVPSGPEVSVFIAPGTAPGEVEAMRGRLSVSAGVVGVRLVPRDQAFGELVRRSGIPATAPERANPLPDVLIVRFGWSQNPDAIEHVAEEARQWAGVDAVQADLQWYRRLVAWSQAARLPVIALVALAGLLVLLSLTAAAAAQIEVRLNEMELLTQIGARPGFIVRPYAYAGAVTLGLAAVLALALAAIALAMTEPPLARLAAASGESFAWREPQIWVLGLVVLVAAALGGSVGWLRARSHLSSKHDS
ncbi:MAG TPA: permease-like cell division protein FtsX [Burkholderiaceae bacterium]|nr:permease-like cell division protein FtsX [Burkholderiaceae bacterium]